MTRRWPTIHSGMSVPPICPCLYIYILVYVWSSHCLRYKTCRISPTTDHVTSAVFPGRVGFSSLVWTFFQIWTLQHHSTRFSPNRRDLRLLLHTSVPRYTMNHGAHLSLIKIVSNGFFEMSRSAAGLRTGVNALLFFLKEQISRESCQSNVATGY